MAHAIELDNLSKTYRDSRFRRFEALRGVSLVVEEGEAFGFVGPNGAGKSSTIKILVNVSRPTDGSARMLGYPIEDPRARKNLGYVPENPYLYDYLTPLEVLTMGMRLHGVQVPDIRKHCMSWLERFRIDHVANKRIRQFSKGMVQRTALAHALACAPKLLILDEPLSGLDPVGRKETVDILEEYHKGGGTLFFSSHVLHDVERLADRFGLIHKGLLRTVQTPGELLDKHGTTVLLYDGPQAIAGAAERGAGTWSLEVKAEAMWEVLAAVREAGGAVREIKPTMSLERAFLEYTAADAA